ncbi:RNA polymerase III C11 subunit [Agyrium rufum]|nr:RNA polymerase III C11 subunit [Agyrium rufum]
MLVFCPTCSNVLHISRNRPSDEYPEGRNRWECRTCPYEYTLTAPWYERKMMARKEVEDVMGGKDAWANVDKTDAQCPREGCDGSYAFFYQVQIRSADEPMTTFYKCTDCGQRWKEN